jgi:hypothetical protein
MDYPLKAQAALPSLLSKVFAGSLIPFIENPSYYKQLLHAAETDAEAGGVNATGLPTVSATLLGQTTIAAESVYKLRFDIARTASPKEQILLYLDTRTFLPVRSVGTIFNVTDLEGAPPGVAINDVADYTIQALPDTSATRAKLKMKRHAGARLVDTTLAQYNRRHRVLTPPH